MGLKLNGATSGSIELDPQANLGSDRVITLNATGNSTLTLPDANGTLDRLERAGNILQVVQNYVDDASSVAVSSSTETAITGFSQSITPTSSTSKILVRVRWNGESSNTNNYDVVFRLLRDGSSVGSHATFGARTSGISGINQGFVDVDANSTIDSTWFEYLDSPNTTSSITYQLAVVSLAASTWYTNRTVGDISNVGRERLTSSITLIEVAA
jgi:hypothetical protein